MTLDMKPAVFELKYRGVIPVKDAKGVQIHCLRGRVWISEWGCFEDVVLEAGQQHVIAQGGVALVQALREALIGLRQPAAPVKTTGGPHDGGFFQPRQ
jgi:hypothetical protein